LGAPRAPSRLFAEDRFHHEIPHSAKYNVPEPLRNADTGL
jgi:hypothetical protein